MVDTFFTDRERGSGITCMYFPHICQFVHGNTQEETAKGVANSSCSANPLGSWLGRVKMAKNVTAVDYKNIFMISKTGVLLLKKTLVFERKFNSATSHFVPSPIL